VITPENRTLFERLKSAGQLPSPKGPALAVMQLTRQDNVSFEQLAKAVNADPALVARLLKLANGCRVTGSRPIVAIRDAVSMLGLTALRGLALGFSLLNDNRSGTCPNFNYAIFWSKNLARAVAMQTLAGVTHILPKEESFTLGLLAHMGELGLASTYPEEYSALLDKKPANLDDLLHQEAILFETDHADLTALMLEDWGIPAVLVAPVRHYEKSSSSQIEADSRAQRLTLLLMLADRIADICLQPQAQRSSLVSELIFLGSKLTIAPDDLPGLCDNIVRDWGEWCDLLKVPLQSVPPFSEWMNFAQSPIEADTDRTMTAREEEKIRVLIVDDDRTMRALLNALLSHIGPGFEYQEATNGQQALELAMKYRPHLMVVDWAMPEMNGIELIKALRNSELGRGIYILILTGMKQDEPHQLEAFDAGADDFLTKPFKAKVLAARVRAGLRIIELNREVERNQTNLKRFASEFSTLTKRLQMACTTDCLTGVLARSQALVWLEQAMHGLTQRQTISAILIQLVNLREINTTRGWQVGDEILRQIAALLEEKLNSQERLARYSGKTFLLLAHNMSSEAISAVIQRIKQSISGSQFLIGENSVAVTANIGYAVGWSSDGGINRLLNDAELNLALELSRSTGVTSDTTAHRNRP